MKELLFSLLKSASILEATSLLAKLKDLEGDNFKTDIVGAYPLFKRLASLAAKTKTGIDDAVADIWLQALEQTAQLNGIELPKL